MFKINLPADRAVIDMGAVAEAFGISANELEQGIEVGIISRWFEVGEGSEDNKPHQIFVSETLGMRVEVDENGNVWSSGKYNTVVNLLPPHPSKYREASSDNDTMEKALGPNMHQNPYTARRAHFDALLDDALDASFPASDPIAINFSSARRTAPLK